MAGFFDKTNNTNYFLDDVTGEKKYFIFNDKIYKYGSNQTIDIDSLPEANVREWAQDIFQIEDGGSLDGESFWSKFNNFAKRNRDGIKFGLKGTELGLMGFDAYNQYKARKTAEKNLKFNKRNVNRTIENQAKDTNRFLADRQRARIGATGDNNASGKYLPMSEYLRKYRADGSPL